MDGLLFGNLPSRTSTVLASYQPGTCDGSSEPAIHFRIMHFGTRHPFRIIHFGNRSHNAAQPNSTNLILRNTRFVPIVHATTQLRSRPASALRRSIIVPCTLPCDSLLLRWCTMRFGAHLRVYSAVQCSPMVYSPIRCSSMVHSAVQCSSKGIQYDSLLVVYKAILTR